MSKMTLQRVELKNFRCFADLDFKLPETPGLYLVTGKNQQSPSLGANGTGKSSLLDGICWILYEKTSKGLKAGKLLNRNQLDKGYSGKLTFNNHVIERTWKPISLKLDGVDVDNKAIAAVVGLSYEQFLQCIYFHQQGSSFIDLGATEKLAFLSSLFELDVFIRSSDINKERLVEAKNRQVRIETAISMQTSELNKVQSYLTDAMTSKTQWETDQAVKIEELRVEIAAKLAAMPTPVESIDYTTELATLIQCEMDIKHKKSTLDKKRYGLLAKAAEITANLKNMQVKIKSLCEKVDTTCPQCEQTIPSSHAKPIAKSLLAQCVPLQTEKAAIDQELVDVDNSVTESEAFLEKIRKKQTKLTHASQAAEHSKSVIETAQRHVDSLDLKLTHLRKELNPYTKQCENLTAELEKLQSNSVANSFDLKAVDEEVSRLLEWTKYFPLWRLEILDNAVSELELSLNEAFQQLGLSEWNVKLSTTKELKTKDAVRKELNVTVLCGKDEIDLDTLSGGERQRVKLACQIGISDLLNNKCAHPWAIKMFDEPSVALSEEGTSDLLDFLSILGDNSQILLLDHRVRELRKFDGVFELTKSVDGNSSMVLR